MKLFKWSDIVFTVAVAAVSLVVWAVLDTAPVGERLVVTLDGKVIATLPLDRDADFTVQGEYTNVIRIKDGKAFMLDTDCPNKICQKEGSIEKTGQSIICAPNKMTASIEGGGEGDVDAVTQ
jgi:hypothetical protein